LFGIPPTFEFISWFSKTVLSLLIFFLPTAWIAHGHVNGVIHKRKRTLQATISPPFLHLFHPFQSLLPSAFLMATMAVIWLLCLDTKQERDRSSSTRSLQFVLPPAIPISFGLFTG
jgi:hypothetical protein